jgi:3-dehydroquinate synthase
MNTLYVELGDRRYPIYIGQDLLAQHDLLHPWIRSQQIMIVTNATVAPLYLDPLKRALGNYDTPSVILPDGEQYKTLEAIGEIMTALLEHRFERSCTLVALGGGVIGDITGFAAACYQRGVDYIQIPTTLLAQVDSSVGGKTAVNHPLGKNMIGAFHQPRCVIADTSTLTTLDDRQLHAGLSEVIKYGLIRDAEFFRWLEEHLSDLLAREPKALAYAIEQSCQNKAEVVARDERESGLRAILNYGHTFAHAVEKLEHYRWRHGDAVAVGMVYAAHLNAITGRVDLVERTKSVLASLGLPTTYEAGRWDDILKVMKIDKKNVGATQRFVLLDALAKPVVVDDVTAEQQREAYERLTA